MHYLRIIILFFLSQSLSMQVYAALDNTQLAVWANEAIVATYTFNYQNFLERQKQIAFYYTAKGWTAYSAALLKAKLQDAVTQNKYYVTSVSTMPPEITTVRPNYWQAVMPLLVVYQNPQYKQKQYLSVTIQFTLTPSGQGVRGLAIDSIQTKEIKPSCKCTPIAHPAPPNPA